MLIRTVTAATCVYRRPRGEELTEEENKLLRRYDRNSIQCNTLKVIVNIMRANGFLASEYRDIEKLRNVFKDAIVELNDKIAQNRVLDVENYGWKSVKLHASSMLAEIFGSIWNPILILSSMESVLEATGQRRDRFRRLLQ